MKSIIKSRTMPLVALIIMSQLCLRSQHIPKFLHSGNMEFGFSTEPRYALSSVFAPVIESRTQTTGAEDQTRIDESPTCNSVAVSQELSQGAEIAKNQLLQESSAQNIPDNTQLTISDSILLRSIVCTSPNTIVAGGEKGAMLYTSDNGLSWIQVQTGTVNTIRKISFLNALAGVAVGDSGLVLLTADGGRSWRFQPQVSTVDLFGASFADQQRIYAVGRRGTVLRSIDFGKTWESINSGAFFSLRSIKNLGSTTAIAVGVEGTIVRTSDGGNSWRHSFSGTMNDLNDASFANAELGIVVGNDGTIVRTTDSGISWSPIQHPFDVHFTCVAFANTNVAVAGASNGAIVRSTNGGVDWELVRDSSVDGLFDISFADPVNGFVVGDNGLIMKTTDSGAHWSTLGQSVAVVAEANKDKKIQTSKTDKKSVEGPISPKRSFSETGERPQFEKQLRIERMPSAQWKPFDASTVLLQIPGAIGGGIVIGGVGALLGAAIDPARGGISAGAVILGAAGVFFGLPTGVYLVGNWKGGNGGYNSTLLSGPGMFLGGLLLYAAAPPFGIFIMSISPVIGPILGYHLSASSTIQEGNSELFRVNQNILTGIPHSVTTPDVRINVVTINF